jgi:hypothetical protein
MTAQPRFRYEPELGTMHCAPGRIRTCDTRFRRDLLFALMHADQRFLRRSRVIDRLHRTLLAPVRPTNGSTAEVPVPDFQGWITHGGRVPTTGASAGRAAQSHAFGWLASLQRRGRKASNGEPAVESLHEFGHSEDLAAVGPLADASVRQMGHEVDEIDGARVSCCHHRQGPERYDRSRSRSRARATASVRVVDCSFR